MDDPDYAGLDEALLPLHLHLAGLVPLEDEHGLAVEELHAEMPAELDVLHHRDRLALGSSPPLYYVPTGFQSARHRLRVTLVERRLLQPDPYGADDP